MIYVVGLTGGIGCGKSTVCDYFAALGVPIIDADVIARELVAKQQPALNEITDHFGTVILQPDGELNRHLLREKIFHTPAERLWLEALLHPIIDKKIVQQIQAVTYAYCIVAIPLLTEHYSRYHALVNEIIVVSAQQAQQLDWATQRDPSNKQLIQKIIASQASSEARLKIADRVIENNGSLEELKIKVNNLHRIFAVKKQE